MHQVPDVHQLARDVPAPGEDGAGHIATIPVQRAANVDQGELASAEGLAFGSAVGVRGLFAEEDDGPEAGAGAGAREERRGGGEQGLLGHADPDAGLQGADDLDGELVDASEDLELRRGLHGADGGDAVGDGRDGEVCGLEARGDEEAGLLIYHHLWALAAEGPSQDVVGRFFFFPLDDILLFVHHVETGNPT